MRKSNKTSGIILTLTGAGLWGFSGTCGQFLFEHKAVTPSWLVPIRLTVAGSLILTLIIFRDGKKIFQIWKTPHDAVQLIMYSLIGLTICQYTYFTTIQYSNVGISTVIQYLNPTLILLYICIKGHRIPRLKELFALFLAVLGTFLLATHGNIHTLAISNKALFFGLLSALTAAFYTIQSDALLKKYNALLITGWGMTIGGGLLMCILRPWQVTGIVLDYETMLAITSIILGGTILSFTFFLTGVRWIGPSQASMIAAIEPVSATFFAIVWLGEKFTNMDFLGISCITITIVLLSFENSNKKNDKKYNF